MGELEGRLEEQAQLLADVEITAASPQAAVAGSEACRCLRAAVTRGPREPDEAIQMLTIFVYVCAHLSARIMWAYPSA